MLPEKHNFKAIFERLKLFKELEPDFKIDKVFYLIEPIEYDFKDINIGSYIVSKPFVSTHTGETLIPCSRRNIHSVTLHCSLKVNYSYYSFTCWRIKVDDFEEQFLTKPLSVMHEFIYKGDKVDD